MTRRRRARIRRKANAWARKARRAAIHRGDGKRRDWTTAELRQWARRWPWARNPHGRAKARWRP